MLLASTKFLWQIPDEWTLEEAATVPIVYLTVSMPTAYAYAVGLDMYLNCVRFL